MSTVKLANTVQSQQQEREGSKKKKEEGEERIGEQKMKNTVLGVLFFSLLILSAPSSSSSSASEGVCIIGSGIGGSSVAHFLRKYSESELIRIRIFERQGVVGGRMATVSVSGETFEAGASILHPKNYHALNFAKSFNLTIQTPSLDSDSSFGIWDGHNFLFKTLDLDFKFPFSQKILSLANSFLMFFRYGFSLFRMTNFVEVPYNISIGLGKSQLHILVHANYTLLT